VAFLNLLKNADRFGARRPMRMILCILLLVAGPQARTQDVGPSEYQVKAAFLYNFAKFVKWPEAAFPAGDTPVIIGILGDDPFGPNLEMAVRNKTVNGHPVVIRRVSPAELKQCQIVFIARTPKRNLAEVSAALNGVAVLTVSELDRFTDSGGMIRFVVESNKVRFEINDAAARAAGLTISSKLLNLAKKREGDK
jgi:YfiR/HmsC-like